MNPHLFYLLTLQLSVAMQVPKPRPGVWWEPEETPSGAGQHSFERDAAENDAFTIS